MRSLFIFVVILSSVPAIFIKPHVGILIWSWISYMNPHKLTFGPAYNFPFLDIIAGATIIALLLSKEAKKIPNHPILWVLFIYAFYTAVTAVGAFVPEQIEIKGILFAKILLFTVLTIMLTTTKSRLDAFVWVIALSLGYFGVKGGLFTVLSGGTSIVWGPPGGFIADNNQLALALVMLVPLLRYLSLHTPNKYVRLGLLGSILFVVLSILGSQSRGALLAVSTMILFLIMLSDKKAIAMVVALATILSAVLFMPQSWKDRMMTVQDYEEDSSASSRLRMWRFAVDVARDHPMGGGFGAFYSNEHRERYLPPGSRGYNAHSIYFEVLGEHGYFGLFLFFWLAMTTFFSAGKIIRTTRQQKNLLWAADLARMVQVAIVGYATAGAFLNLSTFDLYYHLLAIIVILHVLVARELGTVQSVTGWSPLSVLRRKLPVPAKEKAPEPVRAGHLPTKQL